MRARVRAVLRDDASLFIPDNDGNVDGWLNEAQLDLAARLKPTELEKEATGTWAGTSLAFPSDFLSVIWLRIGTVDYVDWVDEETWNTWQATADQPRRLLGRTFKTQFELYPTPSSTSSYTLRYGKVPAALTAGADVPEIRADMQQRLVFYAIGQALLKEHEPGLADRYLQMYYEGVGPHPLGADRKVPGPLTIGYAPNIWDAVGSHRG